MNNQMSGIIPYTVKPNDVLWKIAEQFNTTVYGIAVLNPRLDINQLRVGETIFVWPGLGAKNHIITPGGQDDVFTRSEVELNKLLRMLWQQTVGWMRATALSQLYQLPDYSSNVTRFMRTSSDLEQTFRRYYPRNISAKFGALMREMQELLVRYATAITNKNPDTSQTTRKLLGDKADELAAYLAEINDYWKKETWQELLYQYIDLTGGQIANSVENKYVASIDEFNQLEMKAYSIADYMTNGFIVKFRTLFR